jgi:hypothetical protein
MRRLLLLAANVLVLSAGGFGVAAARSSSRAIHSNRAAAAERLSSRSCSVSIRPNRSPREVRYCEYVFPDGRRFNCNMAYLHTSTPTVSEVESSKACVPLPRLPPPRVSHAVVKAIGRVRACLRHAGLAVKGGPVPPEGRDPGGPEGELIIGGALIAFYIDPSTAKRAEAEVRHEVRRLHGEVERRGGVTVLWLATPPEDLRAKVRRCVSA